MKKRKSNSFRRNLNSVKRGVKSQAFQIRNSLSEIEKTLNKIASNEDIIIKTCKNCSKYFIPIKNTEKYCDNTYYQNETTCKTTGASSSYSKKRNSVEGIKLYRNNYQRRLMQAKRSESEQVKLAFENWKELAKSKIKEFNANKISEEELLEWMKENKNI